MVAVMVMVDDLLRTVQSPTVTPAAGLAAIGKLRCWLDGLALTFTAALAGEGGAVEQRVAEAGHVSARTASRELDRVQVAERMPELAGALTDGAVSGEHLDVMARRLRSVEPDVRAGLVQRQQELVDIAKVATPEKFDRAIASRARSLQSTDGSERLERQRRANRFRSWIDAPSGMWCARLELDPHTGARVDAVLDQALARLFAQQTPATAPSDPVERNQHLRSLAFADLLLSGSGGTVSHVHYVVDTDEAGNTVIDTGTPVELPLSVLAEILDDPTTTVDTIVVRGGVVLHAPGQLNLGRSTRLANRDQRNALRALYPTCGLPGCETPFSRCKIHHIRWWRHGGTTDLSNLLPVCPHDHARLHAEGWILTLGPNRELTITFADGTSIHGPPPGRRRAA
jgi:Domain of unknown function (DUF222)/HNH endonuclease